MFSGDELNRIQSTQSRFINSRLDCTEKHLGDLCNNFASFATRKAKLRDSGDDLCQSLQSYGEEETLNRSLSEALTRVAASLAHVQDYRNEEVVRLEEGVMSSLSSYGKICGGTRDDVRLTLDSRRKEINAKKAADKAAKSRQHPVSRQHQFSDVERQQKRAREGALKSCSEVARKLDDFEATKINDLKTILTQFVKIELAFHSKAVEIFTKAYNQVSKINPEEDLEDFQAAREIYDRVLRNALKGENGSRSDLALEEKEGRISPVILGGSMRRKAAEGKKPNSLSKSVDDLKTREYEEIVETNLSSSDTDY